MKIQVELNLEDVFEEAMYNEATSERINERSCRERQREEI